MKRADVRAFPRRKAALALAAMLAAGAPAVAAEPPSPAESRPADAPGAGTLDLNLPAGPLGAGLSRVAAQAGILFSVEERLVAGLRHPPLQGRLTLREAFERLLQDTGLEPVQDGAALTLRHRAVAGASAPRVLGQAMPEVRVRANGEDAPGSYRFGSAQQALRIETPTLEIPQSVSVLPADFIDDLAPRSLSELLRYVPGLGAAQGEGNRDTPVFRGNPSTSDFLLDGLRDDVQYYRDLYNIERVETLRGPNAAAVGHGATGGLINRITKQPTWTALNRLSMETGTEANRRIALDLNQPAAPRLTTRLNVMAENSGGYRDYFQLRRYGINPVLAWQASDAALLTLAYERFRDRRTADRGVPSYQGRPLDGDPATFFGNPGVSTTWVDVDALTAQLDLDLGAGRALQARTRVAEYDKFFQNAFAGAIRQGANGLEVSLLAHNSRMRRANVFQQVDVSGTAQWGRVQHSWLVGAEFGHQKGDNRRETGFFAAPVPATVLWVPVSQPASDVPVNFQQRASDPDNNTDLQVGALHLQDQIRLSPQWLATLGLRHDHVRLDVDDHQLGQKLASLDRPWSPRAGLLWQPAPALAGYANVSLGYALRGGEQFNLLSPSNQGLSPERFVNREFGIKWTPRPQLEASVALYLLDRSDVAVPDPNAPTQSLLLVNGQRTRGMEFTLGGRVQPSWQVMASYAWQDSRIRTSLSALAPAGASMPHVPRHSFSLWNRWTLDPRWAAAIALTGRSSLFASTDNRVVLPGYARWDGALYFTPAHRWRLQLNVENLLDRRYYAFAHSNSNITPGAPRAARISAQHEF